MAAQALLANGIFVKICGVTAQAGAQAAVQARADAIGVNLFAGSKRYVPLGACVPWLRELEHELLRVAVVVNPSAEELQAVRESGAFDAVQFHGEETPEFCAQCGWTLWIKALRPKSAEELRQGGEFATPYLLLDAWCDGERGGTGHLADWSLARQFVTSQASRKIILAGGLNSENVREAVQTVRPWGLDVASGVEDAPGRKNPAKIQAFVEAAREASRQV